MALGYSNQRYGYFRNGTFWTTRSLSLRALLSATVGGFDHDVLEKFYSLTPDQLARLLNIYSDQYGSGAASYARRTYPDWRSGATRPSAQTINRLLDSLPRVLNFDGKCDLLGKLRERHRTLESHSIKVCSSPARTIFLTKCSAISTKIRRDR